MSQSIVGWILEPDGSNPCHCGAPATVIIGDRDTLDSHTVCDTHIPRGTHDPIAAIFAASIESHTA